MLLSYTFRIVCLALLSAGSVQFLLELALWIVSPRWMQMLAGYGARTQEQALFWGQLMTHGAAWLLTVLVVIPGYIAAETNLLSERVGWLSVAAATLIFIRYLRALLHGLGMWWRASRLQAASRRMSASGESVLEWQALRSFSQCPPLAVVGLLRPRILIAKAILNPSALSAESLSIALDHERSHVRHGDNWKLFVLSCLPRAAIYTTKRPACMQLWQRYNDWAADDDAVRGSSQRALMLAEGLVACAKLIPAKMPVVLFTGFAAHEEELEARIGRLLSAAGGLKNNAAENRWHAFPIYAGIAIGASCCLFLAITPWLHEAAEKALHLG